MCQYLDAPVHVLYYMEERKRERERTKAKEAVECLPVTADTTKYSRPHRNISKQPKPIQTLF